MPDSLFGPGFLLALFISLLAGVTACIDFVKKKYGDEKRFGIVLLAIGLFTPFLTLVASVIQERNDAKDKHHQPVETIGTVEAYIQVEVPANTEDLARYQQRLESTAHLCLRLPSSFRTDDQGQQTTFHVIGRECLPDRIREASAAELLGSLLLDLRFFGRDRRTVEDVLADLERMEPDFSLPLAASIEDELELRYDVARRVFILSSLIRDESPAFTLGKNVGGTGSVEGLAGGRLLVSIVSPNLKGEKLYLGSNSVRLSTFRLGLGGSRSLAITADGVSLKKLDSGRFSAYLYHFPDKIILEVAGSSQ